MIIITGGAGFIGSNLVKSLNEKNIYDIIIVDKLGKGDKWKNLVGLNFVHFFEKDKFLDSLKKFNVNKKSDNNFIIHLGACTDVTEQNMDYLINNNYTYSFILLQWAIENNHKFIYASSFSTYGDSQIFSDDHCNLSKLHPTSKNSLSKHLFDMNFYDTFGYKYVGLKLFDVFGPNEHHKNNMSSMIHKSINRLKRNQSINLFEGTDNYSRDFIYVKDVIKVIFYFMENWSKIEQFGIFNVGTGDNRTFKDVAITISKVMGINRAPITHTHFPKEYIEHYQKFTKADISKLRSIGYKDEFMDLNSALEDYIK